LLLARIYSSHRLIVLFSHMSENISECKWVSELFPNLPDYGSVYDAFGLMTSQTIMAHCIYLSKKERQLMTERSCGVSHCPNSNFSISSGVCNVRQLIEDGIKVGLGTDVRMI
jgi:guanine deaminase